MKSKIRKKKIFRVILWLNGDINKQNLPSLVWRAVWCSPKAVNTYNNWPLQPFSQAYGLAPHTTYVVCFNFTREWRDLRFNVDFVEKKM